MIELKNIDLLFSQGTVLEKHVLKNLSFSIEPGDFITVIGSNGAGKSSLLNMIAGEYMPQKGQILFDEENVTSQRTSERASCVARVFQDPLKGTCGDLTLAENLKLAEDRGKFRGLKRAINTKNRHYYQTLLRHVGLGLEDRLDTQISLLSGGQRQAASLIMATLSPLKILLLDEHTSALDPKTAETIMSFTNQLVQEKKLTTLMITHSLHQALSYGNRIIMMHDGRIIFDCRLPERSQLTVEDLLKKFEQLMDNDKMLMGS